MRAATQPQPVPGAPPAMVLFIDDHPEGKGLYREVPGVLRVSCDDVVRPGRRRGGATHLPDVIVIDLAASRTDAFGAIRQLKAHPDTMRIPIIALGGVGGDPSSLARSAGADVCLLKPCVPSQVARAIQTLLVCQRSRLSPSV